MILNLNLDLITELTDTETDHLGWKELCGGHGQVVELVVEDVRFDSVTRDAAQVIVNNLIDEYDYDDGSKVATNENDPNNDYVIYKIVISCFCRFL